MFTQIFVDYVQSCGKTAYQIAKDTGISQGTMNEYKNGKKFPTIQNLTKIADCLDCSVDYLLGRTDNPQAHKQAAVIGNTGNITDNYGVIGANNAPLTIINGAGNAQKEELIRLYDSLTPTAQAKALVYIDSLTEDLTK